MLNETMSIVGGVGGLAGIGILLQFVRDRRQAALQTRVAERTEDETVEAVAISNLEKKLVYLERLVDTLTKQNERLEERDARRLIRIQELEDKSDTLTSEVRKLKQEIAEFKNEDKL